MEITKVKNKSHKDSVTNDKQNYTKKLLGMDSTTKGDEYEPSYVRYS